MQLGGIQRRGEFERGGEGPTEGRAAQSQKEGEHSSLPFQQKHFSRSYFLIKWELRSWFLMRGVARLFQRRRKRKKTEQAVQNESGEGVTIAVVSPRARFYFSLYITEDVRCASHKDEDEGPGGDSELDGSVSEAEVGADDLKVTPDPCSHVTTAHVAPPGLGRCQKSQIKSSEEVGPPRHVCLR